LEDPAFLEKLGTNFEALQAGTAAITARRGRGQGAQGRLTETIRPSHRSGIQATMKIDITAYDDKFAATLNGNHRNLDIGARRPVKPLVPSSRAAPPKRAS